MWEEIGKRLKENKQETTELLTVNLQDLPCVVWSMDFTTSRSKYVGTKYNFNTHCFFVIVLGMGSWLLGDLF